MFTRVQMGPIQINQATIKSQLDWSSNITQIGKARTACQTWVFHKICNRKAVKYYFVDFFSVYFFCKVVSQKLNKLRSDPTPQFIQTWCSLRLLLMIYVSSDFTFCQLSDLADPVQVDQAVPEVPAPDRQALGLVRKSEIFTFLLFFF